MMCRLVWSRNNPKEDISISDLVMAAFVILEYIVPLNFRSIGIFSGTIPTVSWALKLPSKSLVTGRLLSTLAVRQYVTKS